MTDPNATVNKPPFLREFAARCAANSRKLERDVGEAPRIAVRSRHDVFEPRVVAVRELRPTRAR